MEEQDIVDYSKERGEELVKSIFRSREELLVQLPRLKETSHRLLI